jgi:hypothetical protein
MDMFAADVAGPPAMPARLAAVPAAAAADPGPAIPEQPAAIPAATAETPTAATQPPAANEPVAGEREDPPPSAGAGDDPASAFGLLAVGPPTGIGDRARWAIAFADCTEDELARLAATPPITP